MLLIMLDMVERMMLSTDCISHWNVGYYTADHMFYILLHLHIMLDIVEPIILGVSKHIMLGYVFRFVLGIAKHSYVGYRKAYYVGFCIP